MSQALAALLGALVTAFFSGIILESYKRHRDLQGVASAIAGEIYSLIHIVEKRETAAHFARLLAELEAGRNVDWTDVTGGDPAQDDPVVKSLLGRLGSLPGNIPERIATFYTYLRGIRIDIQNLTKGVFKDPGTQAFIIRADLVFWADATQLGKGVWADLRQVATTQWWPLSLWNRLVARSRLLARQAHHECQKAISKIRGTTDSHRRTPGSPPQPSETEETSNAGALPDTPPAAESFAAPFQDLATAVANDIDTVMLPSIMPNFGGNRERALRHALIDFRSAVYLERASRFLFGSQIDSLIFLGANSGRATIGEIHRFYAAAVESEPEIYTTYPFEGWLGFLCNQGLVGREGDIVSMLPGGKAIISYMQMRGYLRTRAKG
jgi:hypothetical protein